MRFELDKNNASLVAAAAVARFCFVAHYDQNFKEASRSRRVAIAEEVIESAFNFVKGEEDDHVPVDFLLAVTQCLVDSGSYLAEYLVLQEQSSEDEDIE